MKICQVLETVFTGKKVKFIEAKLTVGPKTGNRIVILNDLDNNKKYVIKESIYNFIRFRKWIGKEAFADYKPLLNFTMTNEGNFRNIKLSTEVIVDKEGEQHYEYD